MPKTSYKRYRLDQSPFYCLKSKRDLAKILQVSQKRLESMTCFVESLYSEKDLLASRKRKLLRLEKPESKLKHVHKRIEELLKRIQLPDYVHAPRKGCSYISNAKAHIDSKVVRSLDIEQYFRSTPARSVYWFFHKRMKCSQDIAGILTKLSTYKDHLPTGSPLSPLLSYFSHIDMWEAIENIVNGYGCSLTVYMDDVTISGENVSDKLIWEVKKQFHRFGLRSNKKKEKSYFNARRACEITGVVIKNGELKLPNRQHLKMHIAKQEIRIEKNSERITSLARKLQGLESQRKQIEKSNLNL